MMGFVDWMVKVGFIMCYVDLDDGCVMWLYLIDDGYVVFKCVCVLLCEFNGKLCDGFFDDEFDVVVCWLYVL